MDRYNFYKAEKQSESFSDTNHTFTGKKKRKEMKKQKAEESASCPEWDSSTPQSMGAISEPLHSRLKVQKLRDQSESSSVFLWGLYALGTERVRSGYGARGFSRGRGVTAGSRSKNSATNQNRAVFSYGGCTHLVRSGYGAGTELGGFPGGGGLKLL